MEWMESQTRGNTQIHMHFDPLEWPWEGDNGNYTVNLWRQEVSVSLEATENVTKLC